MKNFFLMLMLLVFSCGLAAASGYSGAPADRQGSSGGSGGSGSHGNGDAPDVPDNEPIDPK